MCDVEKQVVPFYWIPPNTNEIN